MMMMKAIIARILSLREPELIEANWLVSEWAD
jgi:hypothetical protein